MRLKLIRRQDGLLEPFDNESMEAVNGLPIRPIEFTANVRRSLSQNAQVNVWYGMVDKQLNAMPGSTRRLCKLRLGVPILRAESEEFRRFYDKALKWQTYEEKIESMEFVPVTSIMNKSQMTRYMEAVQVFHAENFGIVLESE